MMVPAKALPSMPQGFSPGKTQKTIVINGNGVIYSFETKKLNGNSGLVPTYGAVTVFLFTVAK
jgi:hypothetical protein